MPYSKLGISCCTYNKTIACTSNQKFLPFEDPIYKKRRTCLYTINSDISGTPTRQMENSLSNSYYGKTNEKIPDYNNIKPVINNQCKSC